MELNKFAQELLEDKEDKVIEATKISAEELMPKLNEYKELLEATKETQALAQAKAAIKRKDPDGDAFIKNGKYVIKYNDMYRVYADIEELLKAAVEIQTSRN